jgi:hypothetical protein
MMTSDRDDIILWFRWQSFRALDLSPEVRRTIEEKTPARILGLG